MKEHKGRNLFLFVIVLIFTVACGFVALNGVGGTKQGAAENITLGLDLAGGVSVTYEIEDENPSSEDISDTIYKLQNRVQAYSNDAVVYQEGSDRISVEIPGYYDADEILASLGKPGSLVFAEAVEHTEGEGDDAETHYELNPVCTGEDVADAQVGDGQDKFGNIEYSVRLQFTEEGTKKFADATARNVGKIIYIIYDDQIISYPVVNSVISNGEAYITGTFTYEEANALATSIRLGSLNLTLQDIKSNVVGAQLGENAVSSSLLAGVIGLLIVIALMIIIFKIPGLSAGIALVLYSFLMLLLLNAFDITLTLPGMAGIILSIGMAVDANVIIFSRIQEEIGHNQPVDKAITIGFNKATSAILDGNITTLIAALVLYIMGSGSIKGFATTLALGIIVSMITAMFFTRIIVRAFYSIGAKAPMCYGKRVDKEKPFKYTQKKPIFFIISAVIILVGVITMGVNGGTGKGALNFGLDFTGGTSINMEFEEHIDVTSAEGQALRAIVEAEAGTSDIQLQNVTGTNEIVIKTPTLTPDKRADLKNAIKDNYKINEETITEENISGVISNEMRRDAVIAVIVATACMLVYIWIRFRGVKFGLSAIIALIHDVLVVLMVYAVTRISVGNTFIACMLTIVGYSINATIVIFDRIRENQKLMQGQDLGHIVNTSISQTLGRSIYTSLTTFVMVFVLFLMGVTSIREFALPLIAGIVCGAWSSVFIAGNLWHIMQKKKVKKAAEPQKLPASEAPKGKKKKSKK